MSTPDNSPTKIAIIGAGYGLGATILEEIHRAQPQSKLLAIAPRAPKVEQLKDRVSWIKADVSEGPDQEDALRQIEEFAPDTVICALTRDPSQDVNWNLILTALFPTRLWRWALNQPQLHQVVVVGPGGSGKQGLSALLQTLTAAKPATDLRLYTPPDETGRQGRQWTSEEVAKDLIVWLKHGPRFDHRKLVVSAPI